MLTKELKEKFKNSSKREVMAFLSLDTVLPFLGKPGKKMFPGCDLPIKTSGLRLKSLKRQTDCVCCGLSGNFFVIEKDKKNKREDKPGAGWHLNLYGITKNGGAVLMTRDHIFPKSLGGEESLENSQTMCGRCNLEKADHVPLPFFGMLVEKEMKKFIEQGESPYTKQDHNIAKTRVLAFFRQYKDPAFTEKMASIEINKINEKIDGVKFNPKLSEDGVTPKETTGDAVLMAIGGQMISKSNPEGLDKVLTEYPEMAQAKTSQGQNLLHMAAFRGNLNLLEVLSKHQVPYCEDNLGYTPAWWAVRNRDPQIAKKSMMYFCDQGLETTQVVDNILTHYYGNDLITLSGQMARHKLETPRPTI